MYRKVFIKSEADLPKERQTVLHSNLDGHIRYSEYRKKYKQEWFDVVDWYLRPVTREEIIEVLKNNRELVRTTKGGKPVMGILADDFEKIADELMKGGK